MPKSTSPIASFIWFELPLLACMALIFVLSDQPEAIGVGERGSLIRDVMSYSGHTVIYGLLAILAWRVVQHRANALPGWIAASPKLTAAVLSLLYGVSDEFHQSFVPGRTASFYDLLADLVGILLGLLLISVWQKLHKVHTATHASA